MKIHILSPALFVILVSGLHGQGPVSDNSYIEFAGLTHQQLAKHIFGGEREMISEIEQSRPLLETYVQSLWTGTTTQSPIDDAYFLSTVNFTRGYKESGNGRRGYQTFLFGQNPRSRKIRLNNGDKVDVYPDGYLDMLFVDLEDFDADTYDLSFLRKDIWGDTSCLIFSVVPKMPRNQGRFKGQIWVETSAFKIIRIKGTFTPVAIKRLQLKRFFGIGSIPLYFHFDSTRQEVAPGKWLPSYSYFDENRNWRQIDRDAQTDIHYRGHIFIWGYEGAGAGNNRAQNHRSDAVVRLEKDKLLANPSIVEDGLNSIIRRILAANNINVPDIECRVLLTTPVEIFHIGHIIIVSRGLLNILPDDSVIPILLAHEIQDILFTRSGGSSQSNESAWDRSLALDHNAGYFDRAGYTSLLFAELALHSKQIPNLVRARFGMSLFDIARGLSTRVQPSTSPTGPSHLVLHGKYTVDSWRNTLRVWNMSGGGVTATNVPPY